MASSLIQTVNTNTQAVVETGIISPGAVIRRYGCNCRLSGNAFEIDGQGYYTITATVTAVPTAAGVVTVRLMENGMPIQGAVASTYATTATQPVTLPIVATIRNGCRCDGASNLTFVLEEGAGNVTNFSARIEKK